MVTGSIEYIDYTKNDGGKVALTRIVPGMYTLNVSQQVELELLILFAIFHLR